MLAKSIAAALLAALATAQDATKSVDCTVSYTGAYMSTLNGECSQMACTPSCQAKIDAVRSACANQKYNETDPITGIIAERSFMQKSIQALQLMGPVDCDYRVGYENCDSQRCSMANITGGDDLSSYEKHRCITVDPISGQSAPMAAWHSCEGQCRTEFEGLTHNCSGCTDPTLQSFMADAGRKLVTCTTGNQHNCSWLKDGLNSACCAGPDGVVGNGDDTCNIKQNNMTTSCSHNPVCAAALQSAGTTCPHQFTTNTKMLGLFLDCGGNLQQLFAAEPVDTKAAVYCDATNGHGIAMPGSYDGGGGRRLADATEAELRAEEILAYHQEHAVEEHVEEVEHVHRALQGVPPPDVADPACSFSYQAAFTATVSGECSHHTCTAACQQIISKMLSDCKGQYFSSNDGITNMTVGHAFTGKAVQALQLLGPADCAYHAGYQECGDQCNIVNASRALNGLGPGDSTTLNQECAVFFMGVDFHQWKGCGTPSIPAGGPWNDVAQSVKDRCWDRYVKYVESCSGCTDPFIQTFLKKTAKATANTHCEDCDQPQAIANKIQQVCCAGADGILGNADDPCTAQIERNVDSGAGGTAGHTHDVTWYVPDTCEPNSACQAYIVEIAENGCPSLFISNGDRHADTGGVGIGMYTDCGGNVHDLLAHGADCSSPTVPAHANIGSCNSTAIKSGQPCEMTCQTGWCISGRQPQCFDGQIINTMTCQPQTVQTCTFPPNGGCDPRTSCSDATNLFGTKLVQCSACPSGYYGSGRSGCYDINECTVVRNGGCDLHTSCTNFDGGYSCSACEDIVDPTTGANLGLVGDPNKADGCHPPPPPPSLINNVIYLGQTAGTCTGDCPGNPCGSGLTDQQLSNSEACEAKGCGCKWSPPSEGWPLFFILLMILVPIVCTALVCQLCNKKQYKTEGGSFEKVDVGSIGTGPSIYDSTWAR
jgi:hypothetical protein